MLPPPVSTNVISPTLNRSSRPCTVETRADFSATNGVFQFAELSWMIKTFGRSEVTAAFTVKMSVSSACARSGKLMSNRLANASVASESSLVNRTNIVALPENVQYPFMGRSRCWAGVLSRLG